MVIYGLTDPRNMELRYVGFTSKDLNLRLNGHISDASRYENHRTHWLQSLMKEGLRPDIFVLQETDEQNWKEDEQWNIQYWRSIGSRLTNSNVGGEGNLHPSEETRNKMSKSSMGRKFTWGYKISKAVKGRFIGKNGKFWGKRHTEETKSRISAAKKNKKMGIENPFYEKKHSESSLEKISQSQRRIPQVVVDQIFRLRLSGLSLSQIQSEVSVPFQTVSKILNRKFRYLRQGA